MTLTETWRAHIAWRGGDKLMLGTAWTLCYEEQFYAVMGALVWLARGQARRFFPAAGSVSLLVVPMMFLPYAVTRQISGFFFFDGQWLVFACGIAVYYGLTTRIRNAVLLLVPVVVLGMFVRNLPLTLGAVFGLTLLALRRHDGTLMRARWIAPLRWCGTVSYSLYLVHWPITKALAHLCATRWTTVGPIVLIVIPLCTVASLACAVPFYYFIERRFLNTSSPSDQPVALSVAAAAAYQHH